MALPPQTLGLLDAARCLNEHLAADAIMLLTETQLDWAAVRERLGSCQVIVAADNPKLAPKLRDQCGLTVIELPMDSSPIQERLGNALLRATCSGQLQPLGHVVVVYNGVLNDPDAPEPLDSLSVIHLGEHLERMTTQDLRGLETKVPVETLRLAVDLATQIGREGREGQPIGAILVVGDTRKVMTVSRSINFNPFRGYTREERDLRRSKVREQIKELAKLDGAILINKDGFAVAGCMYLDVPSRGVDLPAGHGSRHWAAASVSRITKAVAICVSQSSGSVRVFHGGEQQLHIAALGSRPHIWSNVRLDTHSQVPPPAPTSYDAGTNGKS